MSSLLAGTSGTFSIGDPDFRPAYRCRLAILAEDDGTYSAIVLNLPGAGSCGASEEEAIKNAREAVRGVVDSYADDGMDIPWETNYKIPAGATCKWILVDA